MAATDMVFLLIMTHSSFGQGVVRVTGSNRHFSSAGHNLDGECSGTVRES